MKYLLLSLSLAAGFASNLTVGQLNAAPPGRESIEWCDIWITHANETNLPRVLLIGDSIARDYFTRQSGRTGRESPRRLTALKAFKTAFHKL